MKFGRKYVFIWTHTESHTTASLEYRISLTDEHSLPRNQVPEWAGSYINYKGLKKLVKAAARAAQDGEQVDLAGVFFIPAHGRIPSPCCWPRLDVSKQS